MTDIIHEVEAEAEKAVDAVEGEAKKVFRVGEEDVVIAEKDVVADAPGVEKVTVAAGETVVKDVAVEVPDVIQHPGNIAADAKKVEVETVAAGETVVQVVEKDAEQVVDDIEAHKVAATETPESWADRFTKLLPDGHEHL
jgi:hypothetical protein